MAQRRMKNGKRFGFVRFKNTENTKKLKRRLKEIWIGTFKLRVFLANGEGRRNKENASHRSEIGWNIKSRQFQGKQFSKSFNDVVKEGGKDKKQEVEREKEKEIKEIKEIIGRWTSDEDTKKRLRCCAVGSLSSLDNLEAVQALCKAVNLSDCSIRAIGGRNVLLDFNQEEAMVNVISNKDNEIHQYIKDLRRWTVGFCAMERLTWLYIVGIPFHTWRREVFEMISGKWGKVLEAENCECEESNSLEYGRVLIATSINSNIDVLKSIKIDDLFYRIIIMEEGVKMTKNWEEGENI